MTMLTRALAAILLSLGASDSARAASFAPCVDAASHPALGGSLCAVESVPGDPSGLSGAPARKVALFVRKFPAAGSARGQVWLVAGGPGESGASFYGVLRKFREAFPGFDLLIPDHRGTGASTRLCPDEEAPGSPAGSALAGAEWSSCFSRLNANRAWTHQFTETNAAHDLKLLLERTPRQGKTFVYGVSYGTQLVLRTMALGDVKVDGLVLDSLMWKQGDEQADLSRASLMADAAGRRILAACDASPRCSARIGEPTGELYRRVLARSAKEPQLLASVPGGNLKLFLGRLLDVPSAAARIPDLLKDLDAGRNEQMQAVLAEVEAEMASLGAFSQSPPSLPLVILISGSENNLRPGRTEEDLLQEEAGLLFTSSIPGHLLTTPLPLYKRDAMFGRLPARLPPTLVLHGDGDGKTPHDAALRHIAALREAGPVRLHSVRNGGHFVLWSDRLCASAEVKRFVLGEGDQVSCVVVSSSH